MNQNEQKILLVEDESLEVMLLKEILKGADFSQFTHADSLEEVLSLLKDDEYDIILTDLSLPDSQGVKTLAAIKEYSKNTPIIVISGINDGHLLNEAEKIGVYDFLVKGQYSGSTLVKTVQKALYKGAS